MKPKHHFEDVSYWLKLLTTASLCGTAISLGISTVIHGATLMQLQYALGLTVTQVSFIFPAFGVGNVLGTIPAGCMPVRWSGRRRHLMAFLVALLGAAMMGLIPNSGNLGVLILAFGLFGFTYGYLDTDLTTVVTDVWGDDNPPYLVAIRCSTSVGVFIGGFACVPFVETVPEGVPKNKTVEVVPSSTASPVVPTSIPVTDQLSKLQEIYIVGMVTMCVTSLFMLSMLMTSRKDVKREEFQRLFTAPDGTYSQENIIKEFERRGRVLTTRDVMTIVFLCTTVATTMATTAAFCNFLATFTIGFLKRPPEDGPLLVSVYGGCSLLSNILAMLFVRVTRPTRLVFFTSTLSIISFILISLFPQNSAVIWTTSVLFGLGNISTMCLTYVTAEQFDYLSKGVAGAFAASTGLAALLSTLFVSALFEADPMVVMYFCLACVVLGAAAFLLAVLVNTREAGG